MRKLLVTTFLIFAAVNLTATHGVAAAEAPAPKTVTLAIENMTCAACPITVRKSLEKVSGVSKVKVDFDTKTATVTFDPAKTDVEALTRATTEAGYPSTLKH